MWIYACVCLCVDIHTQIFTQNHFMLMLQIKMRKKTQNILLLLLGDFSVYFFNVLHVVSCATVLLITLKAKQYYLDVLMFNSKITNLK